MAPQRRPGSRSAPRLALVLSASASFHVPILSALHLAVLPWGQKLIYAPLWSL